MSGKTIDQYKESGELQDFNEVLEDNWNRLIDFESKAVDELEKTLWLASAGAATISIGYLQNAVNPSELQYFGCWAFIVSIILLVLMKVVTDINSSRYRFRYQIALDNFSKGAPDSVLKEAQDCMFKLLRAVYLTFKYLVVVSFLAGCILTLLGLKNPEKTGIEKAPVVTEQSSHNKALLGKPKVPAKKQPPLLPTKS